MAISLAHDSGPVPQFPSATRNQSSRRILVVVLIAVGMIVASMIGAGVWLVRFSVKFGVIDHTRESISWDPNQSRAVSTTYANPAYGVALTLPGQWDSPKAPQNFLCHLYASNGFNAVLKAAFPELNPSIDSVAAINVSILQGRDNWTFDGEESAELSGLPARILHFTTPKHVDCDVILVKRWPVTYALSIAGPADATADWQRIRGAFPEALQIK